MDYKLTELIDIQLLQNLQEKLNAIYSFPSAILDNDGNVLTAVAWQDLCTKYHRRHPQCEKECIKSDQYILKHLHEANPAVTYVCPHGLVDNALPIIISGKHLGNFFTGQIFLEKPDREFFRNQAKKYGFNEVDYLEAVERVPVWTKEKLAQYLDFIKDFIEIIAGIGLTQLKQIEANKVIKESAERNRAIIQSTYDWIWEIEENGKYCYSSDKVERILGYTAAEIIGKTPFDLMSKEEGDRVGTIFKDIVAKKGSIVELENWNIHKDGHKVCLLTNGYPIFSDTGEILGYRGADKDITERKLAEAELVKAKEVAEESERIFSDMTKNSPGVIYQFYARKDGSTGFYYISPKVYEMFGLSTDSEPGDWGLGQRVHPDEKEGFISSVMQAIKEFKEFNYECRLVTNKGLQWCQFLSRPMKKGDEVIFNGIILDITDRKKHELLIKEKGDVIETQNELLKRLNQDLIKAKEQAEESDRLKSAFLANMSHEIRTPMNGILGFAELLKEPGLTGEEQLEYIHIIEKSGARMLNIINDIIDISKIESGLIKLDMEASNINEQIEYIYTFFKPEVEAKGMKLSIRNTLPAKEATIYTDREKLYAILTNLVKNAIKYTNEGSIEFGYNLVETQCIASLQFFVKDTGIGIPKDRLEAIFERFIQADMENAKARQGAGLGLAITKSYVEMLGGKIWVESGDYGGSTFYFTLPYSSNPIDNQLNYKPLSVQKKEPQINVEGRDLKILIVEDDTPSVMLLSLIIKLLGRNILKARNGLEAVEVCRHNPDIDLILMDIQMPLMGGYEATRIIRQFNKDVVIIAQTAYGLAGEMEKAIKAGCNDYISKPIDKNLLLEVILKHLTDTEENKIIEANN